MTTYYEKEIICAICKNKNTYEMTSSFNALGSCDLDTRPPEMQRSTMYAILDTTMSWLWLLCYRHICFRREYG